MKKGVNKCESHCDDWNALHLKMNAIIGLLARMHAFQTLSSKAKQDKVKIATSLINAGLTDEDITSVLGMSCEAVVGLRKKVGR
jgi:hypothetical protein